MKVLKKYGTTFVMAMESALEYRTNFLLSLVGGAFSVIIQFFVWTAIYGGDLEQSMFGYRYNQMITYILLAGVVSRLVSTGFEWDIASDIKNGTLSRFLVQPIRYLPYRVFSFFGNKVIQLGIFTLLSLGIMLVLNFTIGTSFQVSQMFYLPLVIILALMLNCLIFYTLSALAFWITDVAGIFMGMGVISNILCGGIFPLEVFGETAQKIFRFLPFRYIIYLPLNILCGNCTTADIQNGLILQFVWIIVFFTASQLVWKSGMKKFIAVGG